METIDERNKFYWSKAWREMREQIKRRDNNECQDCKRKGKLTTGAGERLIVDHIIELKDRPDLKLEPSNLELKCFTCHEIKHGRMYFGSNFKSNKWRDDEFW